MPNWKIAIQAPDATSKLAAVEFLRLLLKIEPNNIIYREIATWTEEQHKAMDCLYPSTNGEMLLVYPLNGVHKRDGWKLFTMEQMDEIIEYHKSGTDFQIKNFYQSTLTNNRLNGWIDADQLVAGELSIANDDIIRIVSRQYYRQRLLMGKTTLEFCCHGMTSLHHVVAIIDSLRLSIKDFSMGTVLKRMAQFKIPPERCLITVTRDPDSKHIAALHFVVEHYHRETDKVIAALRLNESIRLAVELFMPRTLINPDGEGTPRMVVLRASHSDVILADCQISVGRIDYETWRRLIEVTKDHPRLKLLQNYPIESVV